VSWRDQARCRAEDPEIFYDPTQVARARELCAACPVRTECLGYVQDHRDDWGIWGGLTPAERRRLPRSANAARLLGALKGFRASPAVRGAA
jgi:WhiB family redox-sensing transcriptional regulator